MSDARLVSAPSPDHARETYDAFAPYYDAFTAHHRYEDWMATLERLARRSGLRGRRLLDVACGTGKSFEPFLARGYDVTATDISPEMLKRAARRGRGRARLECHDMRDLPRLGSFDLVCCIDDAVNYLDTPAELEATFAGLERNLAEDGVVVFDANTLFAYRTYFATATLVRADSCIVVWDGHASPEIAAGDACRGDLIAFEPREDGAWTCTPSVDYQRHHRFETVSAALATSGLAVVDTYGMRVDGSVDAGFDEIVNSKAVYVARRSAPDLRRGGDHG
jgi:SAM-dependent methyltransferase